MTRVRVPNLKGLLKLAYRLRRPLFVWGPPGAGKSQIVAQTAREIATEHGLDFRDSPADFPGGEGRFVLVDQRLTLLDPSDIRGLFRIEDGRTHWCPPSWLPRAGRGILFLDELNLAAPAVQAAAYQLILDRRVGEYLLPEGWGVVAAGNRLADRAGVFDMPAPLANRFIHAEFEPNMEDWSAWAIESGVHPSVVAFLTFRPELLSAQPKAGTHAFPTPRSWAYASDLIRASDGGFDPRVVQHAVGEGAGMEFAAFWRLRERIPDPEEYLRDPQRELPDGSDLSLHYALGAVLAERVRSSKSPERTEALIALAGRFPPEVGILTIRLLGPEMKEAIAKTRTWGDLAARWGRYLLPGGSA